MKPQIKTFIFGLLLLSTVIILGLGPVSADNINWVGTPGDDTDIELGTPNDDTISQDGLGGDDTLFIAGGDGNDQINQNGGDGNDQISIKGGFGDDQITQDGGNGNDVINLQGGDGYDQIKQNGGPGDDVLVTVGDDGNDVISVLGGDGNDQIKVDPGLGDDQTTVEAGPGNDEITYSIIEGNDVANINGGPGYDILTINQGFNEFTLFNGDNLIYTTGNPATVITINNIEHVKVIFAGGTEIFDYFPQTEPVQTVTITSPADRSKIKSIPQITANTNPDVGVVRVDFEVKNSADNVVATDSDTNGADGWSYNWNPTDLPTGDYTITATAYDNLGKIGTHQINVQLEADLYANPSFNTVSLIVGQNVVVTFKIGNNGPGKGTDILFAYSIPANMEFLMARTDPADQGTLSYDSITRILTWNMGDVLVGDPYLYVTQRPLSAGEFIINYGFSSTSTLGLNTATMIASAVVNTPATSSDTSSQQYAKAATTTKATIRTVPLQKTGLPLGAGILAILMTLAGLFSSRKGKI
ncbi:MAG: hypothetical protein HVN35_07495 [Methanobacteriaceae archaeon]|nr:hypothetical protein [Methanobacteriaceae archaeon]